MANRISGYGGFGWGRSQDGSGGRAAAFRRGHRVGQKLRGKVLRIPKPGMAWVLVDGRELLASIESAPEPGQTLTFLVRQLDPEIVLQELRGGEGGGGALDAGGLAQLFWSSRARLEALAGEVSASLAGVPPGERRRAYIDGLFRLPDAAGAASALAECLFSARALNELLAGTGEFRYLPWLLAGGRELELIRLGAGGGLEQFRLTFRLPALGRGEVRLFVRPPQVGCRLLLERSLPEAQARRLAEAALAATGYVGGTAAGLADGLPNALPNALPDALPDSLPEALPDALPDGQADDLADGLADNLADGPTDARAAVTGEGLNMEFLGLMRRSPSAPSALTLLLAPESRPGGYLSQV